MTHQQSITVIGLGSMGWGAATRLLSAGFHVKGVDLRKDTLDRFAAQGGEAYATAADAGTSDLVFVFVVNSDQAKDVLFGPNGALTTAARGTVFLLCVTMAPSVCVELASRLQNAGMLVLDAPVSGGQQKALSGEITVMASGPEQAFEKASDALGSIAAKVFRLGDEAGMGSKVKMINQLLAGVHIAATAEALTLAAKVGLDLETVFDVIKVSAGTSWMFENRGPHIVEGDYTPRSAVNIFVKDMGIVTSEANKCGAKTPLSQAALALFDQTAQAGYGLEDDAAVAKSLALDSGVILPGMGD
ncbi:L-threonate dehydrogenase [Ochrobactrum sp. BTU1]|uniref:L-threonate dehydrogenase n=1 Tax=Ochrobactrum sp. BTU1 TaxID=2840456 RepID=UPI001C051946|nr:NAD(P)-dependent oxidoreductase [Ochrobactrum sp. BTU1]